jgi:hypothetical protein
MSKKEHVNKSGTEVTETRHKGESQQSNQKGAKSVANHDLPRHKKDESDGAEKNTTKKQSNNI